MTASEHADTIRNEILRGGPHKSSIVLAALAALEAELAEARSDLLMANTSVRLQAELREAAEAEDARLKAALAPFFRHPRWLSIGSHENTAEIRVSREVYEEAAAALASGSEGDTRRLQFNPGPLSVVDRRDNVTAVNAIRGRSREDRMRVWLALGGTAADFPEASGSEGDTA